MEDTHVCMYWLSKWSGVPYMTISRWVKSGKIPSQKIAGRYVISRADALEFLNKRNDELLEQITKLKKTFRELGIAIKELYPSHASGNPNQTP